MEDRVFVPVRWEHIDEVHALIKRLDSKDAMSTGAGEAVQNRAELLRRVYEGCSAATQRVLLYLAERPGTWIPGKELAVEAARLGTNNVSSQIRSASSQAARLGVSPRPFEIKRGPKRRFIFMMPDEDAEIVREFVS